MRFLLFVCLFFSVVNASTAQNWEEEIGFVYTKGEYLMGTERYEDAIKQLTLVINKNAQYKDALYLRALAKYKIRAFDGSKEDLLIAMDTKGLAANLVQLMGLNEFEMKEYDKALKNLSVAEVLSPDNHETKVAIGQIYQNQGKYSLACHKWSEAFKYGSAEARKLMVKHCDAGVGSVSEDDIVIDDEHDDFFEVSEDPKVDSSVKTKIPSTTNIKHDHSNIQEDDDTSDIDARYAETVDENTIIIDHDINEIIIDEDLSLEIYGNGLGKRKIIDQPNILILSDLSGKVAIKVCVNNAGRVESADIDDERSTIKKQSMVSLAIRKSKQFWFAKSKDKEQCGLIVFNIVGS